MGTLERSAKAEMNEARVKPVIRSKALSHDGKISVLDTGRTRVNWTDLFTLQHFNTALTRVERSTRVETDPAREVG